MKSLYVLLFFSLATLIIKAQDTDRKIQFPDVEGFKTLKVDLHIHTVFSDGSVWPNIRIQEAVRDGLDAISLTEHLEYQPHKQDIPHPDRNRSYEIAVEQAKPHDLLIIHGAEITRKMPPGHSNALFIEDANKLMIEDSLEVFAEAHRQGAFVFWNHPDWIQQRADGVARMTDFHRLLVEKDYLHGIEVVNDLTYSEEALELAKKEGLTAIGTSDIHGLVDYQYRLAEGGHRPVTLVFAEERSIQSIKEALFEGRTVAWYNDLLIGEEQWLDKIIASSLSFDSEGFIGPSSVLQVKVTNNSDATYLLKNTSDYSLQKHSDIVTIAPHSDKLLLVRTLDHEGEQISLSFEVLNAISGKDMHPDLDINIDK
ncbi:Sb-PDE family phosphodiesterase [Portibacter marinus]|uniref:Sb-PDE family phosphodiesterase n=1 Tax=Portibacter marinus TaxID=2898660 RepID=UPI001F41CF39|nr:Sb-PDE family phosphodiesterase [Portibacter marinus]